MNEKPKKQNTQPDLIEAARQEADTLLAAAHEPAAVHPPSDSFPGYEILREIHRGGQAVVYQAIQSSTRRKVALKVMREGPLAESRERARFDREVQILGQLRHPNIVAIHDSGTTAGWSYFAMDYIPGQPLDEYMATAEHSVDETLRLFVKICRAVSAAHLRGVIHRDLKPSNIWIDSSGEPHVLDFGLAKIATGLLTDESQPHLMTITGQFVGSLPWASPEQAEGSPGNIDIRADVYSLGVILFQMLTGCFPYVVVGNMREVLDNILNAQPTRPSTLRRQIKNEVETIVLKCLQKERERRYQSAGELTQDVERFLAGEPIVAKRDSAWYVLRKVALRRRWQIAAIVSVTAVLGSSYGVWAHTQELTKQQEQQRIAALIRADWDARAQEDEVEALYDEFFARLRDGQTTAFERDLFLSNLLKFELSAREICGLEHDWLANVTISVRSSLKESGFWIRTNTVFFLNDREISVFPIAETRGGKGADKTIGSGRKSMAEHLPDLVPPAELELKALNSFTLHWAADFPGDCAPMKQDIPNPIWSGQQTQTKRILVLRALPAEYPLAISEPDVIEKVEAGFHAKKLWVGKGGSVGLEYAYRGPLPLAATVQILDPEDDELAGEFDYFVHSRGFVGGYFCFARDRRISDGFLARIQSGELTTARIRLVPDRQKALDQADLDAYYGLVIERSVPVDDHANRP